MIRRVCVYMGAEEEKEGARGKGGGVEPVFSLTSSSLIGCKETKRIHTLEATDWFFSRCVSVTGRAESRRDGTSWWSPPPPSPLLWSSAPAAVTSLLWSFSLALHSHSPLRIQDPMNKIWSLSFSLLVFCFPLVQQQQKQPKKNLCIRYFSSASSSSPEQHQHHQQSIWISCGWFQSFSPVILEGRRRRRRRRKKK